MNTLVVVEVSNIGRDNTSGLFVTAILLLANSFALHAPEEALDYRVVPAGSLSSHGLNHSG